MQSNKINVLMISYGRGALYENKAGVLDRHIEYASHFESLEILYLTRKKLENLNFGKLNVTPVFGLSYLICLFKSLFKNFKNYQVVTTQDPFLTGILGLFYKKRFGIKLHVQNHSNFIDNKHWIKENRLRNSILNYISKKITIPNADIAFSFFFVLSILKIELSYPGLITIFFPSTSSSSILFFV